MNDFHILPVQGLFYVAMAYIGSYFVTVSCVQTGVYIATWKPRMCFIW